MAMVAYRKSSRTGLAFLVVVLGAVGASSQESAPTESRPEEVLKKNELKRSRSIWVHEGETAALRDLRDTKELYLQFRTALAQQQQFEQGSNNPKAIVEQLRAGIAELNQERAVLGQQIDNLGPSVGNAVVDRHRNDLIQEQNRRAREIDRLNNQIQEIDQQKDQNKEASQQANVEINSLHEKLTKSIEELRKSVDKVTAKYTQLEKNAEVARALAALAEASKTKQKQKLGPSKELLDAVKQLKAFERLVTRESVEPDRENGVYHVQAWLNEKGPFRMVFDTGAGITTIPAQIATQIGLEPRPDDPTIQLEVADGNKVAAKKVTIPKVKVGKVTVTNVECAVMPADRGDVSLLLGQTFIEHVKYTMRSGKLIIERLDTAEPAGDAQAAAGTETNKATGAAIKGGRRTTRPPRAAVKSKRSTQNRPSASGGDAQAPPDGGADPN
jgi:clan AA aspartic protease (TIGR02281 family)